MPGYARLRNRGSMVTLRAFNEPIELSFDWSWVDWDEKPKYAEHLNVVLHTTGKHQPVHSFEIKDGLNIEFSTIEARVRVGIAEPSSRLPNQTDVRPLKHAPRKTTIFDADKSHHVRITDTGKKVSVFVSGGQVDQKYATNAVLEVDYSEKFTEHRISIYNREYVGSARHESQIRNFKVIRLSK